MIRFCLILLIGILCPVFAPAQFLTGININSPINTSTGAVASQLNYDAIAKTGVQQVRVNCLLGPWTSPTDTTLHSGRTWFQTYDLIVQGFESRGVDVYMLIGGEAVNAAGGLTA